MANWIPPVDVAVPVEREGDVVGEARIVSGLILYTTDSRGGIDSQAAALNVEQLEEVAQGMTSRRSVRIALDEAVRQAQAVAVVREGLPAIDVTRRLEDGRQVRVRTGVLFHVFGADEPDDGETCEVLGTGLNVEDLEKWWAPGGGGFTEGGGGEFEPELRAAVDEAFAEAGEQERDVFASPTLRHPDGTPADQVPVDLAAVEEAVRRGARCGSIQVDAAALASILVELKRARGAA